jgi:hypothetical protein
MATPPERRYKSGMKIILFLTCIATLLATSGCIVAEGRHGHDEVIAPIVPVVVVHPAAEVIVR